MELADLHVDTPLKKHPVVNRDSLKCFDKVMINFAFCFLPSGGMPPEAIKDFSKGFFRSTQRAKINTIETFLSHVDELHPHLEPVFSLEGLEDFTDPEDVMEIIEKYPISILSFSWNNDNAFAGGCFGESGGGLTDMGKELLAELEKRDMVLDISHASPNLSVELFESSNPVIATHSNSAHVYDHGRNLQDWQLSAIAEKGGVVGLNIYRKFLGSEGGMKDFLLHLEHIIKVGGEEVAALGSDFDGMNDGIINTPAEYPALFRSIASAFSGDIAKKIFYENAKNSLDINSII